MIIDKLSLVVALLMPVKHAFKHLNCRPKLNNYALTLFYGLLEVFYILSSILVMLLYFNITLQCDNNLDFDL